tara:strand:+ start:264 stop:452 length:189 start_codon:yes stop_codon:yes gene_type:complete
MNKIVLISFIYLLLTNNAYAYLDPGTGSIILSAIVAILATIKHYWLIIKNFFKQKVLKTKKK